MKKTERKPIGNREAGYMTVEVTLVFTVVFFAILLILFVGIVLYQEVHLQSVAVGTSERGSVIYASRVESMETGEKTLEDFKNRDPYRYVPGFDTGTQRAFEEKLNAYVSASAGKNNVRSGGVDEAGVFAEVQDYFIVRRIKVNIKAEYPVPIDGITQMFGLEGAFDIDTASVSTVTDPVEFMRNTDLCVDALKTTDIYGSANETMGKAKEYINKFSNLLKE